MAKHKNRLPQPQQVGSGIPQEQIIQSVPLPQANWSLVDDLTREVKSPVCTLYVGEGTMLQPKMLRSLYDVLESIGKVDRLTLFLRSTGGITEVPWKIVSLLREYCTHLTVLIPEVAHSGATHIALGADRIVMTELATLSSVDPTRRHPLLPSDKNGNPTPSSVQDLKHCVEFIKAQLGSSHTGSDIATIIGELFAHVHPLALGAIEQSAELSKLITRKVLGTREKKLPDEQIEKIVDQLAGKYFSHSFQISRADVRKDLGIEVEEPSKSLKEKMEALLAYYDREVKQVGKAQVGGKSVLLIQTIFIEASQIRKIGYALVDEGLNPIDILWKIIKKGAEPHVSAEQGPQNPGQSN